jgi:hypothetical protein
MKRKADHHLDFLVDAAASHEDPLALLDAKDEDEEESDEERLADGIKLSGGNEGANRSKDGQGGSSSRKISRVRARIYLSLSLSLSFSSRRLCKLKIGVWFRIIDRRGTHHTSLSSHILSSDPSTNPFLHGQVRRTRLFLPSHRRSLPHTYPTPSRSAKRLCSLFLVNNRRRGRAAAGGGG